MGKMRGNANWQKNGKTVIFHIFDRDFFSEFLMMIWWEPALTPYQQHYTSVHSSKSQSKFTIIGT